jgi:hypothetical protein
MFMKHLIVLLILISGILFAPDVIKADPLICDSPNGLVGILGTTCGDAFRNLHTSSIKGLLNGTCPQVINHDFAYGSCSVGPAGPTGPPGPAGTAGATGAPGPAGTPGGSSIATTITAPFSPGSYGNQALMSVVDSDIFYDNSEISYIEEGTGYQFIGKIIGVPVGNVINVLTIKDGPLTPGDLPGPTQNVPLTVYASMLTVPFLGPEVPISFTNFGIPAGFTLLNWPDGLGNNSSLSNGVGNPVSGVIGEVLDLEVGANQLFTINELGDIGLSGGISTGGNASGVFYPWHPATDPTCMIGVGGTTCTTTDITLPAANMRCTANIMGADTLGGVGSFAPRIEYPTTTSFNLTEIAAGVIAGGGIVTFSTTCL